VVLHFNFDMPAIGADQSASTLTASLTGAGQAEWSTFLALMQANPTWKVQLVGKASPEGSVPYNLDLGSRRAQLVAQALSDNGIDGSRIVDVNPECQQVSTGIYTCGEAGATGPEDRQVKVLFLPNP
jgi:hypothetical protein